MGLADTRRSLAVPSVVSSSTPVVLTVPRNRAARGPSARPFPCRRNAWRCSPRARRPARDRSAPGDSPFRLGRIAASPPGNAPVHRSTNLEQRVEIRLNVRIDCGSPTHHHDHRPVQRPCRGHLGIKGHGLRRGTESRLVARARLARQQRLPFERRRVRIFARSCPLSLTAVPV